MAHVVRSNTTISGEEYYPGETLPEVITDQEGRSLRRSENRGDLEILPNPILKLTDFELDADTRSVLRQFLREPSDDIEGFLGELSYKELDHLYRMEYNHWHREGLLETIQSYLDEAKKDEQFDDLLDGTVDEIEEAVEQIDDAERLDRLYQAENDGQGRTTALQVIGERLKELSDSDEE